MCGFRQTARYSRAPRKKAPKKGKDEIDSEQEGEKININQFSVRFDNQDQCEKKCVEGNIIVCKNCSGILNSQSQIISHEDYERAKMNPENSEDQKLQFLNTFQAVWICDFCLNHNSILENEKIPSQAPCYMISKPELNQTQKENNSEKWVIFCVDISSSMTTSVEGKSRIESVKEAISEEVNRMKFQKENVKVGLVTFGSKVQFLTTEDNKTIELAPDSYNDFEKVLSQCQMVGDICHSIDSCFKNIQGKIHDLCTYGSTALGPALLSSIELASKGPAGSKIIFCTDGEANIGIGASFNAKSGEDNFYTKAAAYAKNSKVVVSILSLKGDRCNLKELGKLSLATGGSLLKIDPKCLGTEFSKITQEEMLGTETFMTIKMNHIFEIQTQNSNNLSKDKTTLNEHIGNFSVDTQIAYIFKVLSEEQVLEKKNINMELFKRPKLPMQLQLSYTGRNGAKYMQVVTDWRLLTEDKTLLYQGMNFGLFSASTLQNVSSLIKTEKYEEAEKVILNYYANVESTFSKTQKKQQIDKFNARVKKLENVLKSKKAKTKVAKNKKVKKPKVTKKKVTKKKGSKPDLSSSCSENEVNIDNLLQSDDEEQVLVRELRARSRSRSRSPPSKKKR